MSRRVAKTLPMGPPKASFGLRLFLFAARILGAVTLSAGAAFGLGFLYPFFGDTLVAAAAPAIGPDAASTAVPVAMVALSSFVLSLLFLLVTRPRALG